MANWFQNHPMFSVVGHTLLVGGATFAFTRFVLNDNRLELLRAQVETARSQVESHASKIDFLEQENAQLRVDNSRYVDWLRTDPKGLEGMERRIQELADSLKFNVLSGAPGVSASGQPYAYIATVVKGGTFVDPRTGLTIGIQDVSSDRTASGLLNIPGKPETTNSSIMPGKLWNFEFKQVQYVCRVMNIDWISNRVTIEVRVVED